MRCNHVDISILTEWFETNSARNSNITRFLGGCKPYDYTVPRLFLRTAYYGIWMK